VEAVPGAAGPPPWPGSCVKVAATAAAFTPDERTTSSKCVYVYLKIEVNPELFLEDDKRQLN
jgi:hypothetical protein